MSVLIPTTTEMRRPGGSRSRAALINSGPASAGLFILANSVHRPRPWRSVIFAYGPPISCDCRFDASDMFDDVVTRTIPNIDAECEVGLRLHVAP